ncbi:MAG TPA: hypothetical protein VKT70_09940 [Stellaceae bacterium]|nr:hypothetical protein [Stellaceae bacterium]
MRMTFARIAAALVVVLLAAGSATASEAAISAKQAALIDQYYGLYINKVLLDDLGAIDALNKALAVLGKRPTGAAAKKAAELWIAKGNIYSRLALQPGGRHPVEVKEALAAYDEADRLDPNNALHKQ